MILTKRLSAICELVRSSRGIADVGTDHGYIPVWFALQGYRGNIYASDIHPAPLEGARRCAEEEGVAEKITFCCADGLDFCPPEAVDSVIIAGLGGEVITSILDRAEWTMNPGIQLILQPMTKGEILRYWLVNNGYAIDEERVIAEAGKVFSLFSSHFTGCNTRYSDAELYIGKSVQLRSSAAAPAYVAKEAARIEKHLRGLRMAGASENEIRFVQDIYDGLQDILRDLQETADAQEAVYSKLQNHPIK